MIQSNNSSNSSTADGHCQDGRHYKFRGLKQSEKKRQSKPQTPTQIEKLQLLFVNGMKQVKTQKSIEGNHTPRKPPTTPRKQLFNTKVVKTHQMILQDVVHRLKQVLKQFQQLLTNIKNQYNKILTSILHESTKTLKTFLQKHNKNIKPKTVLNPEQIQFQHDESQLINSCHSILVLPEELSRIDQKMPTDQKQQSIDLKNNKWIYTIYTDQIQCKKNTNISQLRQRITKESTGTSVPRNEKQSLYQPKYFRKCNQRQGQNNNSRTLQTPSSLQSRGQDRKQVTTSIEKIQNRLTFLKNILNQ